MVDCIDDASRFFSVEENGYTKGGGGRVEGEKRGKGGSDEGDVKENDDDDDEGVDEEECARERTCSRVCVVADRLVPQDASLLWVHC